MADKKPIKATYSGTDSTGLAEFVGTDTIGVVDGGTGLATVATDNILTGNGTNALSAEANLTFDGSTLTVAGDQVITNGNGMIVGHTARVAANGVTAETQILGTGDADSAIVHGRWSADAASPLFYFIKSRAGSIGAGASASNAADDGDRLGQIIWCVDDGTDYQHDGARIWAEAEGNAASNNIPTSLHFGTCPSGASTITERMRISSAGSVGVGDLSAYSGGTSDPAGAPPTGSTNAKVLKIDGGYDVDGALQISGHNDSHGLDIWTDVSTGDVYFDQRGNHDTYDFRFRTKTTGTPVSAFTITGAGVISKSSGSFKIDHPLPEKTDTHHLVHSFVEGPQADLLYRGTATLSSGTATVNIDTAARMTDGTFVALNGNVQAFTTNETAFDNVRALVSGNILTITSEDNTSTATISWLVVGERKDAHMVSGGTTWTDSDGRVITEPSKESDADRMTPARQAAEAEAEAAAEAKITALESA